MLIVLAHNRTGTKEDGTSDYNVEVRVNETVIWSGFVKGHLRSSGWQPLLRQIADRGTE